jgi:hypothetical protein
MLDSRAGLQRSRRVSFRFELTDFLDGKYVRVYLYR